MLASDIHQGLFSDKVFSSTDLQRSSRAVLDQALVSPVTISRNNEQFALLTRDEAANLMQAQKVLLLTANLTRLVVQKIQGAAVPPEMSWIDNLATEDLRAMVSEVAECAYDAAAKGDGWEKVFEVIRAWRETASLSQSKEFQSALAAEGEPGLELPSPQSQLLIGK